MILKHGRGENIMYIEETQRVVVESISSHVTNEGGGGEYDD